MRALLLLLGSCKQVSVFGFEGGGGWYFDKIKNRMARGPLGKSLHGWLKERGRWPKLQVLSSRGGVSWRRMLSVRDEVEEAEEAEAVEEEEEEEEVEVEEEEEEEEEEAVKEQERAVEEEAVEEELGVGDGSGGGGGGGGPRPLPRRRRRRLLSGLPATHIISVERECMNFFVKAGIVKKPK